MLLLFYLFLIFIVGSFGYLISFILKRLFGRKGFIIGLIATLAIFMLPFADYFYAPEIFDEYVMKNKGAGNVETLSVEGYLIDPDPDSSGHAEIYVFKFRPLLKSGYKYLETYLYINRVDRRKVFVLVKLDEGAECYNSSPIETGYGKIIDNKIEAFFDGFVRAYNKCPDIKLSKNSVSEYAYVDIELLSPINHNGIVIHGSRSFIYRVSDRNIVAESKSFYTSSWFNRHLGPAHGAGPTWTYSEEPLDKNLPFILRPSIRGTERY